MPHAEYTASEIAELGEALYTQRIAKHLSDADLGKFLVIDIETGDYAIAQDDLIATKQVLSKRPDAVTYGVRIGYPAAYRLRSRTAGKAQTIA
ncbi:MAG: hypothetical protein AB7R89_02255 [Dehalococcoidia bacterium]